MSSHFCEPTTPLTADCTFRSPTMAFSRLVGTSTFIGNTESMLYPKRNRKLTESTRVASVSFCGALPRMSKKRKTLHLFLELTEKVLMQRRTITSMAIPKIEAEETNPSRRKRRTATASKPLLVENKQSLVALECHHNGQYYSLEHSRDETKYLLQ